MRFCTALLCCLALSPATLFAGEKPFHFPAAKTASGELRYINTVPVLSVAGTPEQIGAGVGKLAVTPARRILTYPHELLKLRHVDLLWNTFLGSGRTMFKQFPTPYRAEVEAIVRTAKCDRDLVIAGNTFFDLKKVFACSALMVEKERSAVGGTMLARNLDYPSLGYIHQYTLVTVYHPKGKKAFASVGFPGLVGVLSGMNEDGLAVGVLEVFEMKTGEPYFDAKGVPYALCLRQVLEEAGTIDEAVKVLNKLRRTTTINIAIADRSGVAVLEVSPKRVVKRSAQAGICATTNHFRSVELKTPRLTNANRTLERLARLDEVRDMKGKLTPDDLRRQMNAVNLGTQTLQTMVFEPNTLRLHLSVGTLPASAGTLKQVDLKDLLKPPTDRR